MKNLLFIFTLSVTLFSCSKDDAPTPVTAARVKVIEAIESTIKFGAGNTDVYTTKFSYNPNKEISKIEYFFNNNYRLSYEFAYQNNIPTSGNYDSVFDNVPAYPVTFGFANNKFASFFDSFLNSTTNFSFDQQFNQYTNATNGNRFILNDKDDISIRSYGSNGNEYAFTFDVNKKGPLFNVVNKKWIPLVYYGLNNVRVIEMSTYPITAVFDDNIAQNNPLTNTYDSEGFIIKSVFTTSNGDNAYEINYTYKNI